MDVIRFPKYESIIYHPSLLPKHRGASSINWCDLLAFCFHMLPIVFLSPYFTVFKDFSCLKLYMLRTLINGDKTSGFTIFWADEGLDTGPILLQKQVAVDENDTVDSIYGRFMMPEGIKGMAEAVELIAAGKAPKIPQSEEGASYEPHVSAKPELAKVSMRTKLDFGCVEKIILLSDILYLR